MIHNDLSSKCCHHVPRDLDRHHPPLNVHHFEYLQGVNAPHKHTGYDHAAVAPKSQAKPRSRPSVRFLLSTMIAYVLF
jgi:hypothetical protein